MDKFLATGLRPDHIDFHVCMTPKQLKAAMKLAKKYHLPMRAQNQQIENILKNMVLPMHHAIFQIFIIMEQLKHC